MYDELCDSEYDDDDDRTSEESTSHSQSQKIENDVKSSDAMSSAVRANGRCNVGVLKTFYSGYIAFLMWVINVKSDGVDVVCVLTLELSVNVVV